MAYLPATDDDRVQMLDATGAASVEDLFAGIAKHLRGDAWGVPPVNWTVVVEMAGPMVCRGMKSSN